MAQAHFHGVARRAENGVAGYFGAGACSGGNGDHRQRRIDQAQAFADHFEVVEQSRRDWRPAAAMALAASMALPPPMATTKSQPASAKGRDAFADQIDGGLARNRKAALGDAVGIYARGIFSRYEENPLAERCDRGGKFGKFTGSKEDASGGGEFKPVYHPASPGNRFSYFTEVRGSAIISATASRHFA